MTEDEIRDELDELAYDEIYTIAIELTHDFSPVPLEQIGIGQCVSVWGHPDKSDSTVVIKCQRPGAEILNEWSQQLAVCHRVRMAAGILPPLALSFNIPRQLGVVFPGWPLWQQITPRLSIDTFNGNAILCEKIPSMPESVRRQVLEISCGEKFREENLLRPLNQYCLIRPCLSLRRRRCGRSNATSVDLRTIELNAPQLEKFGLNTEDYSRAMGEALAFLHYCVGVDGAGIKFVLAGPTPSPNQKSSSIESSVASSQPSCRHMQTLGVTEFRHGTFGPHSLWLLDFDCCKPFSDEHEMVAAAAAGFWLNYPYFPSPRSMVEDGSSHYHHTWLWAVFRVRYLAIAEHILGRGRTQTPLQVLELIERTRPCLGTR